ncbi:MAG: nicotinate phosphoribosyltransferase, partial [Bryobacteraceae bacterium]
VLLGGRLVEPLPGLEQARERARESVARLSPVLRQLETAEPWPVIYSRELRALMERTRSNLVGAAPVS